MLQATIESKAFGQIQIRKVKPRLFKDIISALGRQHGRLLICVMKVLLHIPMEGPGPLVAEWLAQGTAISLTEGLLSLPQRAALFMVWKGTGMKWLSVRKDMHVQRGFCIELFAFRRFDSMSPCPTLSLFC